MPKGGRKKKKDEPQPFKPEPADLDENEVAYLWDRVAPSAPNPLSTAATLYTFATNQSVVATGPVSSVVAGAASSCVPLLSPQPAHPNSQGSTQGKRGFGASTIMSPSSPGPQSGAQGALNQEGDLGSPSAGGATAMALSGAGETPSSPFIRHSGFHVPSRPPRASETSKHVMQQRAVYTVGSSERTWQGTVDKLKSKTEDETMIDGSIEAQRKQLELDRKHLAQNINRDEATLAENTAHHQKDLDAQQHAYNMKQAALDGSLTALYAKREQVKAHLQDRDLIRKEIRVAKEKLDSLKKNHDTARKLKEEELNREVEQLKVDMVNRLKKTMQDMEDLTMQHRERRQQRAVSESARLVSKLTALEAKSKALTASNTKLGAKVESTKRDQQLEQERHALLANKSQGLAQEIRELSAQLQKCEKLFSERTSATNQSQEVLTLSETIDRQYRVILELKSELDTVKTDTGDLRDKLKEVQQAQYKALQSVAGGNPNAIVSTKAKAEGQLVANPASSATGGSVPPPSQHDLSRIHGLIVKAVNDINKSMLEMSQGQRGIEQVSDPKEQAELLGYIMKRVAMFQSGVFPTKPGLRKSGPVKELVAKSGDATPRRLLKGPADTPESHRITPSSQRPLPGSQSARVGATTLGGSCRSSTSSMGSAMAATGGTTSRQPRPSATVSLPTLRAQN